VENWIRFFSPAKLNLFFRVLRKREDGFHDIASLYQAIDLGDDLFVALSEEDELTCSDPLLDCGKENLVRRAVDLFRKKTGLDAFRIRCRLIKRIPIQTGLGGGSSNAATMLFACNELAGRPASYHDLIQWSGEIGSDVAFFFSSGSAYCTGRGEIIRNVDYDWSGEFPQPCYIAKPEFGLSTPAVYRACVPSELPSRDPLEVLQGFLQGRPLWFNDLEQAACRVSLEFQNYINGLRRLGFDQAVLTGSGSGVFCFGLELPPSIEGVRFYPIRPLARDPQGWYPYLQNSEDIFNTIS
jgi:4-diphosphocytidyl-2-C-methyl-D-erythritol kinase